MTQAPITPSVAPVLFHRLSVKIDDNKGFSIPDVASDRIEKVKQNLKDKYAEASSLEISVGPGITRRLIVVPKSRKRRGLFDPEDKLLQKPIGKRGGMGESAMVAIVNTTTGEYFQSKIDAAISVGVSPQSISQHLKGRIKELKGNTLREATPAERIAKRMLSSKSKNTRQADDEIGDSILFDELTL